MWTYIFIVGIGGFLGSAARFILTEFATLISPSFPLGVVLVNFIGCFLAGFALYSIAPGKIFDPSMRHFLNTGFLGAFTTLAAFMYDAVVFFEHRDYVLGVLNIVINVTLALVGVLLGRWCALILFGR